MTTFLSSDPTMYKAYMEGKDLYAMIAQSAFDNNYEDNLEFWPEGTELEIDGQKVIAGHKTHLNPDGKERRSVGKVLNLAATYGMGGATAGATLGKSREEGERLLENFFKGFGGVKVAIEQSKDFLRKNEYVEDFIGRRRRLTDINLPKYTVELKAKSGEDINFNPFLICKNREIKDPKITKWENRINDEIKKFQSFIQKKAEESDKPFEPTGEMSSKAFDKIQKEAYADGIIISANTGKIAQAERQCFNARIQGCLSYDSVICTSLGLKRIGDMSNQSTKVFDGKDWTDAIILPSGKKEKCVLTMGTGNQIVCSPEHKFLALETSGKCTFKKLTELKGQDRLIYSECYPEFHNAPKLRDITGINYVGEAYNSHNYSFDDIGNNYIKGQILGRIASDGSFSLRKDGGSSVRLFVAEHEAEIMEFLKRNLSCWTYSVQTSQKKNQKLCAITIYSTTLVKECQFLNIKHDVADYLMSDSDLLRGFISGMFDGDGCSANSNNNINLVFGKQADFSNMSNKISMALSMFGIRNTNRTFRDRTRVDIKRADSKLFADIIGFINSKKQEQAKRKATKKDNHTWGTYKVTTIKNIEYTKELVDMFDVCNTERGYFIVNGIVTHNSAASLTKIAMIDIANDPQLKEWGAELIITVHDEVLVECPEKYADLVEKRLPEIMVNAAKKVGDDVPQSCDPYNVSRWYCDSAAAAILKEYKKVEKENDRDTAINLVIKNHTEIPRDAIVKTIETGCDLEF